LPDPTKDDVSVDIERFVERHLRVRLDQHAELDDNILGVTHFTPGRPPRTEINRDLTGSALEEEDATPGMIGRWRATVAHEAGHVLLHQMLYEIDDMQRGLFRDPAQEERRTVNLMRCQKRDVVYRTNGASDWREVQANKAIGGLLMPRPVAVKVISAEIDKFNGPLVAGSAGFEHLVDEVARRFLVSKQAARIRIQGLGIATPRGQGSL
jgi:hypothetical protein